jgi:alkylation response protein AidB-like acyl-CoA dehydrogenase
MHFDLSDDQREIKRTARELLAKRAGPDQVRAVAESGAPDAALAAELAELGWPGIAISDEHGGLGLGSVEVAVLLEELGYAVAGAPLLATASAAFVLAAAGSEAQRAEWLPRIAAGEATAALGIARGGVAELVPDAAGADVIVLVDGDAVAVSDASRGKRAPAPGAPGAAQAEARPVATASATLLSAAQAEVAPVATIDPTRTYARVTAAPGAGEPLSGDPAPGLQRAAIAVAAELTGVCQRALDDTVAYVGEREQFGRPIGSFQAVAHRCADMLLATESARSAAYGGAWAADADPAGLPFAAALAKSVASAAALEVTASAIQAHGGVGFTWEADLHWLYKRAQLDAQLLGGAGTHRAELARLLPARG